MQPQHIKTRNRSATTLIFIANLLAAPLIVSSGCDLDGDGKNTETIATEPEPICQSGDCDAGTKTVTAELVNESRRGSKLTCSYETAVDFPCCTFDKIWVVGQSIPNATTQVTITQDGTTQANANLTRGGNAPGTFSKGTTALSCSTAGCATGTFEFEVVYSPVDNASCPATMDLEFANVD